MLAVAADAGADLPPTLMAGCLPLDTAAGAGCFCAGNGDDGRAEGEGSAAVVVVVVNGGVGTLSGLSFWIVSEICSRSSFSVKL